MAIFEIIMIGLALSMDAFAVTLSNSTAYPNLPLAKRMLIPAVFALFQAAMPVIGYFVGSLISDWLAQYAAYIALLLLAIIGAKMIWEGAQGLRKANHGDAAKGNTPATKNLGLPTLLIQGVATSVDALLVGVSFVALGADIVLAAFTIGFTTFVCCVAALLIGKRLGALLGSRSEIFGGVILILIGLKAAFF